METKIKDLPQSQKQIEVVIPSAEMEPYVRQATEQIAKEIKIDGFRPGKAPVEIMKQHVSEAEIYQQAGELALRESYLKIIKENNLEPISQPRIDITKITPGNPLEYKIVLTILPTVTLSDYTKIKGGLEKKEIEEERINEELNNLQQTRARLVPKTEAATEGDRIEIDFAGKLEGKELENATSKSQFLIIGKNRFIPDFEKNLIGLKENEEKEFSVVFPKEYHQKDLAGKSVDFKVKVKTVQKIELPEINDEFAKSFGGMESLAALKANIKEGLEKYEESLARHKLREQMADQILKGSKAEIPDLLVEEELGYMIKELEVNVAQSGVKFENYLKNAKITIEELQKKYRPNAANRAKWNLIVKEIVKREKIEVLEKELEDKVEEIMKAYQEQDKKKLDMERFRGYLKETLAAEKVFAMLEKFAYGNSK